MSRKRQDAGLTGGTGDVNPQLFRFPLIERSAGTADQNAEVTVPTPLPGFNAVAANKAVVMEVLRVFFSAEYSFAVSATNVQLQTIAFLAGGAAPSGAYVRAAWASPRVIAVHQWRKDTRNSSSAVEGSSSSDSTWSVDLTDGAGHGFLLAAPNVTLEWRLDAGGGVTLNSSYYSCAFLYRFKEVALSEYIGILNSQNVAS